MTQNMPRLRPDGPNNSLQSVVTDDVRKRMGRARVVLCLPNAIQADDEMDKAEYQKVAPEELVLARSVQRRASSIDHLLAKVSMLFDPLEQRKEGVPGSRHEFVGSARPDDRLHAGCREACLEISAAHLERPSPFFSLHTHEHLHSLERDVVHCPSWPTSM